MGDGGASIVVELAERSVRETLASDWILPHEMEHLAVPSVSRPHHWIEEGLAVYLQPIARARAGELTPLAGVARVRPGDARRGVPTRGDRRPRRRARLGADVLGRRHVLSGGRPRHPPPHRKPPRPRGRDARRARVRAAASRPMWRFPACSTRPRRGRDAVFRRCTRRWDASEWSVDLARRVPRPRRRRPGQRRKLVDDAPLAAVRRAITGPLRAEAPEPTACRWATPGLMAQR